MKTFENTEIAFKIKDNKVLKQAYVLFSIMNNRNIVGLGKFMLNVSMFLHLPVKFIIRSTVFRHFCGGETMSESEKIIRQLSEYNVKTILDYSVEGKDSEADFDRSYETILKTVDNASVHDSIPFAVFKVTGMARFDLLQKVNNGTSMTASEEDEFARVKNRIRGICQRGYDHGVPILIDAEESWIQRAIDDVVEEMMGAFNRKTAIVFNTVQLYRRDRLRYLEKSIATARINNYFYGIKLVRGAYLEKEKERAKKMKYEDPIHSGKSATDGDFNRALELCVSNLDIVSVCCGSHNEESNALLAELIEKNGIAHDDHRIYFAQLLGMSDHISFNLSHRGYNVAKYVPFGPIYDVMPYLIRRTEENSSIAGQSSRELLLIRKELMRRKAIKSS